MFLIPQLLHLDAKWMWNQIHFFSVDPSFKEIIKAAISFFFPRQKVIIC